MKPKPAQNSKILRSLKANFCFFCAPFCVTETYVLNVTTHFWHTPDLPLHWIGCWTSHPLEGICFFCKDHHFSLSTPSWCVMLVCPCALIYVWNFWPTHMVLPKKVCEFFFAAQCCSMICGGTATFVTCRSRHVMRLGYRKDLAVS